MSPNDPIKNRLLEIEAQKDALRTKDQSLVRDLLPLVEKMHPNALADGLLSWETDAPDAVNLLLEAASREEKTALHVARALVQLLTGWRDGVGPSSGVDAVLIRVFPKLAEPERDWVAERVAVRAKYNLVPGKDFIPMGEPEEGDQWPAGKRLPPIDDIRGVQARLLRAGYNSGPITGTFNEETRRALLRYQVECALPPTGQLDAATRERLALED
jgi:putative peptidoglycan binding protein